MRAALAIVTALAFMPSPAGSATPVQPQYKGKCISNPPVDSMMKHRVPAADVTIPKCDMLVRTSATSLTFYRSGKPVFTFNGHFDEPSTLIVDEVAIGDAAPMPVEGGGCATFGGLPGPMLATCTADWHSDGRPVGVAILFEIKKLVQSE